MAYNRRYNRRASNQPGKSRWMDLHYAGTCKVCGSAVPAGTLAFYDAAAKTVTCHSIECADKDGLTTESPLTGPWDKRTDTRVFTDHRIGQSAPRSITVRFNSGESMSVNSRGRCEDAPCCGCCT